MPRPKGRASSAKAPPAKAPKSKVPKALAQAISCAHNLQCLLEDAPGWESGSDEEILSLLTQVDDATAKLRRLQSACTINFAPHKRIGDDFKGLTAWLLDHGVDLSTAPFRFGEVNEDPSNCTLFATRDILPGEHLISIPDSVMLSTASARASEIFALAKEAHCLNTPSILLAVYLLSEAMNNSSRFQAYIRTLPATFSTPFFSFSASDIASLRPSSAFRRAAATTRAQLRHYTVLYTLFGRLNHPPFPLHNFTLENYLWAVSVVMTRQNAIPSGGPTELALVPVWDMCNHAPGAHTTSVMLQPDASGGAMRAWVECSAMAEFHCGDPVTICYGSRGNVELLLYSGFVQSDNVNDEVTVNLKMPASDPLHKLKLNMLRASASAPVEAVQEDTDWIISTKVKRNGSVSAGGMAAMRVIAWEKEDIAKQMRSSEGLPDHALRDEECKVAKVFFDALSRRIAEYKEFELQLKGKRHELAAEICNEELQLLMHVEQSLLGRFGKDAL